MLILLPPSEGKAVPRRGTRLDLARLAHPALTPARDRVLDALVDLCEQRADAAEVLGLGPTQADEVRRNAGLRDAPTARAGRVYTGVLYDHLDAATLPTVAKRLAARRLLVTSSLYGLVRPSDPIASYRLSGDVRLPGLGGVAAHWRHHLGPVVDEAAGDGLVVDLRSGTYAAFWRPGKDGGPAPERVVTVRVLHEQGGKRSVVSHFNKATKGRIVRSLLEDGGHPRRVPGFVDQLGDLGWTVEVGPSGPTGTRLDVVVREV